MNEKLLSAEDLAEYQNRLRRVQDLKDQINDFQRQKEINEVRVRDILAKHGVNSVTEFREKLEAAKIKVLAKSEELQAYIDVTEPKVRAVHDKLFER